METKKLLKACLAAVLALCLAGCGAAAPSQPAPSAPPAAETTATEPPAAETAVPEPPPAETPEAEEPPAEAAPVEKNGEIYILYTSDIHCGIDRGFGFAGLRQVRDTLEAQGYTTLLVDDGDAIQGEPIGTLSGGEAIVALMNEMGYDVAIPGNHEFDYGMDRFLELTEQAEFPYISCNFTYQDALVFEPYVILEAAGKRIGFVGVTTPTTLTGISPLFVQNEAGEYVYGFLQDKTGEGVYAAVQGAVDAARAEGAELVYVLGHCGLEEGARPWTYADIIEHTRGIDVFLDGHSHDTEQVVMKNMDGESVTRSACGTKLECIGYSHISAEGEVLETGIWSWPNRVSAPELLGIENGISEQVEAAFLAQEEQMGAVVAHTPFALTIFEPETVDASGNPVRMVRRAETNLGDLCADAIRIGTGADIAFQNGGGVRVSIEKGDITYGDLLRVYPFGNSICVIEATGQQILDALEWGARVLPGENGGFLQVSGMSYAVDVSVESGCIADENSMMAAIEGPRRVKNVLVGGEPIDPDQTYTLAGIKFMLVDHGDGYTMFDGAPLLQDQVKQDSQALIEYISDTLGGEIGDAYADPYGQGRIVILQDGEQEG